MSLASSQRRRPSLWAAAVRTSCKRHSCTNKAMVTSDACNFSQAGLISVKQGVAGPSTPTALAHKHLTLSQYSSCTSGPTPQHDMKLRRTSKRLLKTPQPNEEAEAMSMTPSGMTPLYEWDGRRLGQSSEWVHSWRNQ